MPKWAYPLEVKNNHIIDMYELHPHKEIERTLAGLHHHLYINAFYDEAKQIENSIADIHTADNINNYIAYRNIENREFAKAYELIFKLSSVFDRDRAIEYLAEAILYNREPVFLT